MIKLYIFGIMRLLLRTIIFIHIISGTITNLWALDPEKTLDQYLVSSWKKADGIPCDSLHYITQTPDGYLWITNDKGLVRFDGLTFTPINIPFPKKNVVPTSLFVDSKGILWISSNIGLTSYNYHKRKYTHYTDDDGLPADTIRIIREDMNGNLWISFKSSYTCRFSNGKFETFNTEHGLDAKKINAIVEDRRGNLLFASREKGIFKYRGGRFKKMNVQVLNGHHVLSLIEDSEGILWVGTTTGLFRIGEEKTEYYTSGEGLSEGYVMKILEDSNHNIWIGTQKGLSRLKKRKDGTLDVDVMFNSLAIVYLFEDREKNLWIATDDSGLRCLRDGKFTSYTPLRKYGTETLISVFRDSHDDIWFGTLNGKTFRFRNSRLVESFEPPILSGTGITAFGETSDGYLWIGTLGKGLWKRPINGDEANVELQPLNNGDGLADDIIMSIFRDSNNQMWFSTSDGLSVLNNSSGKIKSFTSRQGLVGKAVHNIYQDKKGDIWVASDKGLTILKKGIIQDIDLKNKPKYYLEGSYITCWYEDSTPSRGNDTVYWIATRGDGLKRLSIKKGTNGQKYSLFTYDKTNGMGSNFLFQFFEDRYGNFWFMSDNGILRVGKNDLNRLAEEESGIIQCSSFGISDGMKSLQYHNPSSRHSALCNPNGELWFVTHKGISVLNPGKIHINKQPPPVVIESVSLNRKSIPISEEHDSYHLEETADFFAQFTAPTFLSPEKIKFKYQLVGVEKYPQYLLPGRQRTVLYENLSPGDYEFKVKACNGDGVWSRTGDSFKFSIHPLFYQTLYFKIILILVITPLLIISYIGYKRNRIRQEKQKRFERERLEAERKEVERRERELKKLAQESAEKEKKEKYQGFHLEPEYARECIRKLDRLIEVNKIYSDADISLQSLADTLSMSPHVLSRILNEKIGRNFSEFINFHRIEEAKRLLKTPKGARQKITTLANDVGFNTMTAFYNAFRKYTGVTPKEYKKSINTGKEQK